MKQMTIYKIEMQIKAISRGIQTGNIKNIHSAKGKINQLKNILLIGKDKKRINDWLSK